MIYVHRDEDDDDDDDDDGCLSAWATVKKKGRYGATSGAGFRWWCPSEVNRVNSWCTSLPFHDGLWG